ncbi:MAG: TAXI family TRAP transporter solute-binding subunit [Desulfobacteraceae bacterium]|nr:TAXI family TRAP transporter solute-binding subunit [Desulfobacteraceae bacterium]
MFKKLGKLTLILICTLSLLALGSTGFAASKKFVRMFSGPEGGSWYPLGAAMMSIVEENIEGISTSCGPGGGVGNCKDVQSGRADLGWTYTHTSYNAYKGGGKFDKEHTKLRHIMSLYPGVFQMAVPEKSDIDSVSDLADKRIVPGKVGFTGTAIAEVILKAHGITFESIKKNGGSVSFVGYADSAALMKDGHSDCYMAVTSCPQSTIIDLNFQPGIRIIGIDDEHMKKVLEIEPGLMRTQIPQDAYEGMDGPVQTAGTVTQIVGSADLSDELVYKIVKTIWEHRSDLMEVKKKAIEDSKLENALQGNKIPVHPGAEKYYKEVGVLK